MIRRLLTVALAAALTLAPVAAHAVTGTPMPYVKLQFFDSSGLVCNGCKLYTYAAGTSTPLATYTTAALSVANTNPVILDSAGRASVFLSATSYKFVLDSAADVTIWTMDNIGAVPFVNTDLDIPGTAGEALTAGNVVYLSDGSGGCGATAGRWYKADADLTCSSTTAQAVGFIPTDIASAASGSIRLSGRLTGLAGLSTGSVYYVSATAGAITSSAPTNSRPVAVSDSTTSIVISSGTTPAPASSTQAGIIALAAQDLGTGRKTVQAGSSSSRATVGGLILGPYITDLTTTGTGANDSIAAVPSIPANTLTTAGDVLTAVYYGTHSANANNLTWTFILGGTTIDTATVTPAGVGDWRLTIEIHMRTTTTQKIVMQLDYSDGGGPTHATSTSVTAGTKDLTTALTFNVQMTNAVAGTMTFNGAYFRLN